MALARAGQGRHDDGAMEILVAYASRHGATRGIAERIADVLRAEGLEAIALEARSVKRPAAYDAFVVGSAAYMFRWLGDATSFVRRNRAVLAGNPVWLFSSGPLGTSPIDEQGRDVRSVSMPREIPDLMATLGAREHKVFFGAYHAGSPIGLAERFMSLMPAAKNALPEGDFRDWPEIEEWAREIASALRPEPAGAGTSPAGAPDSTA